MNEIEIAPGVFQIEEDYRVYCVFAAGKASCVLWDTGMGKRDLSEYAKSKAALPLTVMNSHGHYDHTGGNFRFPRVLIAREDALLPDAPLSWEAADLPVGLETDLGGETCVCVDLSGHTRGSRGLLLKRSRLLLSGDALEPRLRLMQPGAGTLDDMKATLLRALDMPFDSYAGGHTPGLLGKEQIEAHLSHLEALGRGDVRALPGADGSGSRVWRSRFRSGSLRSDLLADRPVP